MTTEIWTTKYALTAGIVRTQAKISDRFAHVPPGSAGHQIDGFYHGEGREWCRTEAEALARAEQMRQDRIVSLHRQIAKLEKMTVRVIRGNDNG